MFHHFPKGSTLRFEYEGSDGQVSPRIGILLGVRDLEREPLSTQALEARPELSRGRWLFRVWDLAREEPRHFYGCRMASMRLTDLQASASMARNFQKGA